MPELPEVETVVRGLSPRLTGRRVAETLVRRPAASPRRWSAAPICAGRFPPGWPSA